MAAPLRRSTRIDGSAGGEPLSCGNQSTYNRVANAGNLHRLSPFQMPFGILHNLTGKSSLTFSIEKCHFITVIPRMTKSKKSEWSLFLNERNRICYNELCRRCVNSCKQSFRAVVISCNYVSKRSVKDCG